MRMLFAITLLLISGCKIDFGPPTPVPDNPVVETINYAEMSDALARLAERCGKSNSRYATQELAGVLSELSSDGVDTSYGDRVKLAVPSIGSKPARDLDASEIEALRGVR